LRKLSNPKRPAKKVIGTFCVYVPRNTCALIKAFLGFKFAGLCPYVELTGLIVGETTCDGKKKAYEILDEITKKAYVMELPNKKGDDGRRLWRNEIKHFAEKL
jgi:benzoyl-CoA reductase/2-hydroxyglutaryl-CoA dehydratase subunit BcrC/BadD/HgdB